jgi:hypothetical protein
VLARQLTARPRPLPEPSLRSTSMGKERGRDVALLAGHRYQAADYAPGEVAVFETLRHATAERGRQALGASRLVVTVADHLVPIGTLYLDLLTARGFRVTPLSTSAFCRDRDGVVRAAVNAGCEPFLIAYALPACKPDRTSGEPNLVVVLRYDDPCPANRTAERSLRHGPSCSAGRGASLGAPISHRRRCSVPRSSTPPSGDTTRR